jgi:AAA domain
MSAETKFSFRAWSNMLPTKPPEALIEGILLRGRLGVIFAKPDNGKTFVALSMALSVDTGEPFAGRAVLKGPTIYIAAEGGYDLEERVPAWRTLHPNAGEPEGGCYAQEVNFFDYDKNGNDEVSEFIKHLNGVRVELLVIDTLAAVMIGGDEDRAKDMNVVVTNVKRVMKATGCAALIVHHAGWDTNREKGSIALRAAADVVIETALADEKPDGSRTVTLSCRKMKSMRKFEAFGIELVPVETEVGAFKCLAIASSAGPAAKPAKIASKKEEGLDAMLLVLSLMFGARGATRGEWMAKMQNWGKGWSEANFDKKLGELKKAGRVIGGGAQGEFYTIVPSAAQPAAPTVGPALGLAGHNREPIQPESAEGEGELSLQNYPRQTTLKPHPLKGGEGSEGSFGVLKVHSNYPQRENEGSSLQGSKDEKRVATEVEAAHGGAGKTEGESDLVADAIAHLKTKPAKG